MSTYDAENAATLLKARLLNRANEADEDYEITLTRYVWERFLYRLYCSPYRNEFVLKGAMFFQLWRPLPHLVTSDFNFNILVKKIVTICETEVPDDCVTFNLHEIMTGQIHREAIYKGQRIRLPAFIGSLQIPLQIDIDTGNSIKFYPTDSEYPMLLDMPPPPRLLLHSFAPITEKLASIIHNGANVQMHDFLDLWFFFTTFDHDLEMMAVTVERAFADWDLPIPWEVPIGLSQAVAEDAQKQVKWDQFAKKIMYGELLWHDVVDQIRTMAMRIFLAALDGL